MKTLLRLLVLVGLSAGLTACSTVNSGARPGKPERPARLQIVVDVPPSMSMLRDDYVAEAFAHRVSSALHEQGLRGRIRYVDFPDDLKADVPVLDIMLHEWRVDRLGNVDCTFSAQLKTASGNRALGVYSGTSMMMWARRDWFARQDGFESAARDALSNLGARLIATGLLADMAPR